MLIINRKHGYSANRKYIQGKGFMDTLTSGLKGVGSYISQNKDLVAKPLIGAVGDLAAFGLLEGGKAVINTLKNRKTNKLQNDPGFSAKDIEILQSIMSSDNPVGNIIGSGIKKF
jgi:hypothetical protein